MSLPAVDKIGTFALTNSNSPLTISANDSITSISIEGTSATAVTVLGDGGAFKGGDTALSVSNTSNPLTITAVHGKVLGSLTITAPSGATANIVYRR